MFIKVDSLPIAGEISHGEIYDELPAGGGAVAAVKLAKLTGQRIHFITALGRDLIGKKRFLFRSAASLINSLANLSLNPYTLDKLVSLRLKSSEDSLKPGLIMVGSYVKLSDEQLSFVLAEESCEGVELSIEKFYNAFYRCPSNLDLANLENEYFERLSKILNSKKTPVFYTSRGEIDYLKAFLSSWKEVSSSPFIFS